MLQSDAPGLDRTLIRVRRRRLNARLAVAVLAVVGAIAAAPTARSLTNGDPAPACSARLQLRVLGGGGLASVGLAIALAAPRWSTRLIDLGPSIYARQPMNAAAVEDFLAHRGVRQLAFKEGWNE